MKRIFTRKRVVFLATLAVAAIGAVAAYAYFTTTGTGTGTAAVGSSTGVTIHGTALTSLYPGTSSEVDFTIDNPSTGHQYVTTIHLESVSTDETHQACVMTAYTMPDVTVNQDFPSGDGTAVTAHGTLTMANSGNQDACKGAPLTLHLSSS